jgi:hypothetical protein
MAAHLWQSAAAAAGVRTWPSRINADSQTRPELQTISSADSTRATIVHHKDVSYMSATLAMMHHGELWRMHLAARCLKRMRDTPSYAEVGVAPH